MQRIERLHSSILQKKYFVNLEETAERIPPQPLQDVPAMEAQSVHATQLNEFLMYHGTQHRSVKNICEQGGDPRRAGTHAGTLFGNGFYLATNSSKADIYTDLNDQRERCVFVMRACLGEVFETLVPMQTTVRAPADHDSVRALTGTHWRHNQPVIGTVEHPEFIVYKSEQLLPEYLITYRHRDECKCTHCAPALPV